MYDVIVVGAEVRDGVSALSCTEQDGFVEVSLHGENNYTESARKRYSIKFVKLKGIQKWPLKFY